MKNYIEIYNKRKYGVIMCEALKKMSGLKAEEILEMANQTNVIPVNLDKIVEFLEVRLFPTDFTDIEKKERKRVYGLVLLNDEDVGIFYKEKDTLEQKRYIISHEIAHCCLHAEYLKDGYIELLSDNCDEKESEESADKFAMSLLIPENGLKDVLSKLVKPSIKTIADLFQVPIKLAKKRMLDLNLPYFDDESNRMVSRD